MSAINTLIQDRDAYYDKFKADWLATVADNASDLPTDWQNKFPAYKGDPRGKRTRPLERAVQPEPMFGCSWP